MDVVIDLICRVFANFLQFLKIQRSFEAELVLSWMVRIRAIGLSLIFER